MAQARRPSGGDGALQRRRAGHVERLWPADTVRAAAREGLGEIGEIAGIVDRAVAVDKHDDVAPGCLGGDIASGTRPAPGVVEQTQVAMVAGQGGDDGARAVGGAAVGNDDLEAIGGIVL